MTIDAFKCALFLFIALGVLWALSGAEDKL